MSAQSLALLQADYAGLSKESGRRHADVREAADKAHQLLKASKDQAFADLRTEPPPPQQPLYQPIFLASATRNAKVIALAVSALQRLISAGAVPKSLVKQVLNTLEQVLPQGVEIQLKILQTLVSLLTTKVGGNGADKKQPLVQGEELGQALELSHRLSTSKIPVVASTASATLRQLFMFVYERIGDEDALVAASPNPSTDPSLPPASFDVDVPPLEEDRAKGLVVQSKRIQLAGDAPDSPAASPKAGDAQGAGVGVDGQNKMRSIALRPAARDAYLLLEDLCLLISGSVEGGPDGEPSFLRWGSLSRTFGLELVESIVSGFGPVVRTHPELLLVLRAHLCPLLIRFLSSPPHSTLSTSTSSSFSFPLTLRLTRVVFLLLKQFSDLLTLESEVFLTMFVRVIAPGDKGEGEGGHPAGPGAGNSPLWVRVLALEIFRGLCGDFPLMMKFYQRYDAASKTDGEGGQGKGAKGGSTVFSDLMTAFNRLATEKPTALGVGAAVMYGSSMGPIGLGHQSAASMSSTNITGGGGAHAATTGSAMIDSAMEMGLGLAHAAGSVVGSSVAAAAGAASGAAAAGLSAPTASLKLQCIDQLDKADPPPIPETYIFLLALQCLVSLADGFASYTLGTYAAVIEERAKAVGQTPSKAPAALDWAKLDVDQDVKIASLRVVKEMAETSWPALLASLSFFIATALSDDLFTDVVSALQSFTSVCGVLNLSTPREAFLTSLCKFAMPPAVVSYIASQDAPVSKPSSSSAAATASAVLSAGVESLGLGGALGASSALPVGLSSRNLACLRALLAVANYLAGSLGLTWFSVFETLQNADFVLRVNASRSKKRSAGPGATVGPPATPPRPATGVSSSAPGGPGAGDMAQQSKLPALPTEADEQAIQQSIAKLFDVSKPLEDQAFKEFVGALCRLNGEMVGMGMNEDGTVRDEEMFGGGGGSGVATPMETPDRSRRRSSGISTLKTQRLGERSFGISKLGVVALLNIQRLIYRDPHVGWDLVTSHLLLVLHSIFIPTSIRLQAAETLGQILVLAPKNLSAAPTDLQQRVQTQVLTVLASQAEPAPRLQTSTDVEIRRMALESLLKILETNGHAFVAGWDRIFHVLRTACPTSHYIAPPSPAPPSTADFSRKSLDTITESDRIEPVTPLRSAGGAGGSYFASERTAKTSVLVRTSFPSLQLICSDFLGGLTVDDLRDCIGTLAEFGKQIEEVNVALTAGGLLWSVSDHVQAKRKGGDDEAAYGELWMYLLHQLLNLCRDTRQEVRDAAITNIFRSISMYGTTLSRQTWETCCWEIIFPLVEEITAAIQLHNHRAADGDGALAEEEVVPQASGPPIRLVDKQWDDSKTLALRSMGDVFFDYLPKIVKTGRYEGIWLALVGHLRQSFVEDRPLPATAAMQALEKVLTVALESTEASRIASSWEIAWIAWDKMGTAIESNAHSSRGKFFTQVNLEAFVRVVLPIYTPPYITFDLSRISRLLAILKAVIAYTRSPDYRPDIDGLMPLQSAVLEVVAVLKLDEIPGATSAVLSDLSEYLTLAFVAPFKSEPGPGTASRIHRPQSVTYIALAKEVMPHVLWLFQKYKDDPSVYEQGAVEKMLAAYALPMHLKHDCPAPGKFGSAEPLWKTATVNFLKVVRDVVPALRTFGSELPLASFVAIWRQIVEGYRGALLAETGIAFARSLDELHAEENFDLALLLSLEQDVLPHIGHSPVPDDLIRDLGKTLQLASRLYELDLPIHLGKESPVAHQQSFSSLQPVGADYTPPPTPPEPRFDGDFDRQVKGAMHGTTVEVAEVGRERFAYWSFDLLFLLCSNEAQDHEPERRRVAALCLPSLLNRCAAVIMTYVADAPLRGKMPFPRIRQEELTYVLQKLLATRLREGTLWASAQPEPSTAVAWPLQLDTSLPLPVLIRSALLRSPLAHLYELHPLFTALLALSTSSPSITSTYVPYSRVVGISDDSGGEPSLEGLPSGFEIKRIGRLPSAGGEAFQGDVVKLVLACLAQVGAEIGAGGSF
ncbi:hypothetical protein JCM1841_000223 [Sporobolomyces salmonicolor]